MEKKKPLPISATVKCGGCIEPTDLGESGNRGDIDKAKKIAEAQNCARKCMSEFNQNINKSPLDQSTKDTIEKWFNIKEGEMV